MNECEKISTFGQIIGVGSSSIPWREREPWKKPTSTVKETVPWIHFSTGIGCSFDSTFDLFMFAPRLQGSARLNKPIERPAQKLSVSYFLYTVEPGLSDLKWGESVSDNRKVG